MAGRCPAVRARPRRACPCPHRPRPMLAMQPPSSGLLPLSPCAVAAAAAAASSLSVRRRETVGERLLLSQCMHLPRRLAPPSPSPLLDRSSTVTALAPLGTGACACSRWLASSPTMRAGACPASTSSAPRLRRHFRDASETLPKHLGEALGKGEGGGRSREPSRSLSPAGTLPRDTSETRPRHCRDLFRRHTT